MKPLRNGNEIKMAAIAAMTIDHLAWMLFPGYPTHWLPVLMHIMGRITCPIMCFFIAEGYHYTKNINQYTGRLFVFSVISHFAYVFALGDFRDWSSFLPFCDGQILDQTSVMWSLAWGLVMLRVVNCGKIRRSSVKVLLIVLICLISFPSDWSCIASLCILAFGTNRGNFKVQMQWMLFYTALYATVYFFAIDKVYGLLQMGVVLAVPILRMYNGQRGPSEKRNRAMKWLFYWYYPLHLLVIGWIQFVR
ncbi:MAG: conjugal transfer protein TraX [Oscillospiraceae bacterium]|nr:conjugal transfer protein TraX [Oscillospiraceae bacterium]